MLKLPIGIQTFEKIRSDSYVYIDKTKEALELINSYTYVFLSRPRRFGKSLFLDTLRNIFENKKEYFKDLYIYDKYDWNTKYPVIKISFAGDLKTKEGIEQVFRGILRENQDYLNITCDKTLDVPNCLYYLIEKAYKKYNQKVVILVDEYDKPLLDNITDETMATHAKNQLKAFYEIIKKADEYIKFAFITGVSKFAKVSLFSGPNNLQDITLHPKYGNICGYTHNDIETTFKPLLDGVNLEELKTWYNGYNFLKDKVYNPFDILLFIDNGKIYKNYWFSTGTPTFLIELIKEQKYYIPNLQNVTVGDELLDSFDINNIDIEILLFQTGYLTIKEQLQNPIGGILYSLQIPNKEIKLSLNGAILDMLTQSHTTRIQAQSDAYYALSSANLEDFKTTLETLFSSLPYENYTNNTIQKYEGYYASVIYAYLSSLGFPLQTQSQTNKGRIDLVIEINSNVYIIEFKVTNEKAIKQIKENKYYEKYLHVNKDVYLVGINFDKVERNISKFEWEKINEKLKMKN